MVSYPISVRRNHYRGSNANKKAKAQQENHVASILEVHINNQLRAQASPVQDHQYHTIARETDIDERVVRDLCFSIDCGHNGFTAYRQDLSLQEASDFLHAGA
jgi:hypothetical protein